MDVTDRPVNALSSFELFLQGKLKPVETTQSLLRAGSICPACGQGKLDYNGVLALECPACGFTVGEGGGCT
ncbi:MAG: hypothetical protein Fur0043_05000 [Anaerolineales bacterium]